MYKTVHKCIKIYNQKQNKTREALGWPGTTGSRVQGPGVQGRVTTESVDIVRRNPCRVAVSRRCVLGLQDSGPWSPGPWTLVPGRWRLWPLRSCLLPSASCLASIARRLGGF